ncbi:MAG: hypothetical protein ACRCZI_07015 [Cetobacterium sp.]
MKVSKGKGEYEFKQYNFDFKGVTECGKKCVFFFKGKFHTRLIRKRGTPEAYVSLAGRILYLKNYTREVK